MKEKKGEERGEWERDSDGVGGQPYKFSLLKIGKKVPKVPV